MIEMTPVERVSSLLSAVGYKRLPSPLSVGGLQFEFPAVFIGAGTSKDLIVVADTAFDKEQRIQQKIEALARALDVFRSRRPLTAVVVGLRPRNSTLENLSRVCRVLPVGSASHDQNLRNWLAILLPLNLPEPQEEVIVLNEDSAPRDLETDPSIQSLLNAAHAGEAATRERLSALIAEPFEELDNEADEVI
jgi:hypothetical protein